MSTKAWLLFMLLATGAVCTAAEEQKTFSPDALIDRLIASPGAFDQMCSTPPELKPGIPLPIYGEVLCRVLHLSSENVAELKEHRTGAVGVLTLRFARMDVTKPAPPPPEPKIDGDEKVISSGLSPKFYNGIYQEMIVSLDAVETLPELLRMEEQYHDLIVAAQANPKFKLPAIPLDGCYMEPSGKHVLSARDKQILPFQLMQRQMLSLMMQLLRRQHYQPLLDTDFEKTYAAALQARARQEDLRDVKTPADAKAQDKEWVHFDPIYNVPVGYMEDYPSVEFNAKVREQVRGLVEEFVKTVPREQWKVNAE